MEIPKRAFGKLGWQVTLLGIGTAELGEEKASIEMLSLALDQGVNYLDTAPSYQGTRSEQSIGKIAKTRRKEFYLATKTLERAKTGALRELDESLKRLNTDYLDLWQIHAVNQMSELDAVLQRGGVIEAAQEAKKSGKIRAIGITGHTRPEVLIEALNRFSFDSVLVPLSPFDAHLHDFAKELIPLAVKKGTAVIGMKVLKGAQRAEKLKDPTSYLHYALSLPVSTIIVGSTTPAQARQNIEAVRRFKPLTAEERTRLETDCRADANAEVLWWKKR
jgi:aryl-alcohol dehydrogenase-like predicted oxidoreductase